MRLTVMSDYHTDVHEAVKCARAVSSLSVRSGEAGCDGGSEKGAVVNDGPGSGPQDGNERATARRLLACGLEPPSGTRSIASRRRRGPRAPHLDHRRAGRRQDLAGARACSPLATLLGMGARRFDEGHDSTRLPAIDRPFIGRAHGRGPRAGTSAAALDRCTTTTSTAGAGCWSSMKPIAGPRSCGTKSRPSSINRVGRVGSRPWSFWAIRSWFGRSPLADSAALRPACVSIFTCRRSISTKHASCWY